MARRMGYGRRSRQAKYAVLALAILAAWAAYALLTGSVFVLKNVTVTGNERFEAENIVRYAGLEIGQNIFRVDVEALRERFRDSGYVELLSVERKLPDTVELAVREHEARGLIHYLGVSLLIDSDGSILEQRSDMPDLGVPVVTGIKLTAFQVGERIASNIPGQARSIQNVLRALYEVGCAGRVSELNVANLDSMYLMEQTGMMVVLGDDARLESKLRWMVRVLDELAGQGVTKGTLDVSSGESAVYIPVKT